jgi:hypothetical protein
MMLSNMSTTNTPPPRVLAQRTRTLARLSSNRDFESVTARLLTQGGDTRIALNAQGLNTYGFGPRPDPGLVQFGSSTGSVISAGGFRAAVALFRRLYGPLGSYHQEVERQRRELSQLSGAADLPGTKLVFAASGTDIHLFAAHLATQGQSGRYHAVMVEPSETGSGVPAALAALHFATQTSQGASVQRGAPISASALSAPVSVKLRHADGSLRSTPEVDAEFAAHVADLMQTDGRCLLVLTDVSKTGLVAPSLACTAALRTQYGERLSVLVDACQFRASAGTLQAYLAQEFMVAITGSKFVGGPAFCGALLLPPGVAQRGRAVALNVLVDYSARSDWPADWQSARVLQESANLGQLLRWEAALVELHRFKAIPEQHTNDFLYAWQRAVSTRLAQDDTFGALPVMALSRGTTSGRLGWDGVQTILGFRVFKPIAGGGREVLSLEETTQLYQQLRGARGAPGATGIRFQLGQPVLCGQQDGRPVGALRLCSGARLVTESMAKHQSVTCAIEQAMLALDQIALLVQALR